MMRVSPAAKAPGSYPGIGSSSLPPATSYFSRGILKENDFPLDIGEIEKRLLWCLTSLHLIDNSTTGSVTVHVNQGVITDYEKKEIHLKKKIRL